MAWFDPNDALASANSLLTEEQIQQRRKIAQALAARNAGEVMTSPWQAVAKGVEGLVDGYQSSKLDQAERTGRAGAAAAGAGLFDGGAPAVVAPVDPVVAPVAAADAPVGGGQTPTVPGDLLPHFQKASEETGIPVPVLVAQAKQESNLNPNAIGRAGEIGLTQIMPATARDPGFGVEGVDPAALKDPATNILFGARYLAGRGKAAGVTDWNDPAQVTKALTAYNGGGDPNYAANVFRHMPAAQTIAKAAPVRVASADPSMVPATPSPAMAAQPVAVPAAAPAPVARVAAAMPPMAITPPPAGVQAVAQAYSGPSPAQVKAAQQVLTGPYASFASPGQQAVAKAIIEKSMVDPNTYRSTALDVQRKQAELPGVALTQEGQRLANQKSQYELGGLPIIQEGHRLDNETKRAALTRPNTDVIRDPNTGEILTIDKNNPTGLNILRQAGPNQKAPTTLNVKQPDGSEVATQWDPASQKWIPLDAPGGGNAVKAPQKLTEGQSKDIGFYTRGAEANKNLAPLEKALIDPQQALAGSLPGVGNSLVSKDFQLAQQAGREYLTALLRKDSGGAITPQEEEFYGKMYLPRVGDAPEVLAQKKVARERAMDAIKSGLGTAEALVASQAKDAPAAKAPPADMLSKAQEAIKRGADPAAVRKRLQDGGYSVDGL